MFTIKWPHVSKNCGDAAPTILKVIYFKVSDAAPWQRRDAAVCGRADVERVWWSDAGRGIILPEVGDKTDCNRADVNESKFDR